MEQNALARAFGLPVECSDDTRAADRARPASSRPTAPIRSDTARGFPRPISPAALRRLRPNRVLPQPVEVRPFFRTICGRGYSGHAFSGETSLVHRVLSGPSAGCQAQAAFTTTLIANSTKPHQQFRLFIAILRLTESCGGHCILPHTKDWSPDGSMRSPDLTPICRASKGCIMLTTLACAAGSNPGLDRSQPRIVYVCT